MRAIFPEHVTNAPARERGVALVDFALVVPVLLAFLLGLIDFGSLAMRRSHLYRALSNTANFVVRQQGGCESQARSRLAQELSDSLNHAVRVWAGTEIPLDGGSSRTLFRLSATAEVSCLSCPIIYMGRGGTVSIGATASAVLEQTTGCTWAGAW